MSTARTATSPDASAFGGSRACFEDIVAWLEGTDTASLSHGELEDDLDRRGRDLLRRLLQDHLDLRAQREQRMEVIDSDGARYGSVEAGHTRTLATIFGAVTVERFAYRHRGSANLHPADAVLNLPEERHSHGLRRLAAIESTRGSFEDAVEAIERGTGVAVGKRQTEELAAKATLDIEGFYATRELSPAQEGDVLVISADGKGIVMRPDSLRPATAAKAATATTKLETRLSKGEKRNRKRLAEVGAVYDVAPSARTPTDIMSAHDDGPPPAPAPRAKNKWLTASVVEDAAQVVSAIFAEAERRDPYHQRTWIALVDGNNHQIDRIEAEAKARGVTVHIVCDLVHVLEYLWDAAWCFFDEGDPAAEAWVRDRALAVLDGHPQTVAAGLRRRATQAGLSATKRKKADEAARYLNNKADYLDYPTALAAGWPIATGVIEGACRHLVKDRMNITGARWTTQGAEAVLKLRAVQTNGDLDSYWDYHLEQERHRVHAAHYANRLTPAAA
jgi:hypothetical protein